MLKFLLRALFKPTYRLKAKSNRKPVRETRSYKSGRTITASPAQPTHPSLVRQKEPRRLMHRTQSR
ncbi:hypothetical protein SB748_36260, partial [Rhizobium sp. SIMBA_035]